MEMEKQAQIHESLAIKSKGQDALNHAIKAAEMYMEAAEEVSDKVNAARLRQKCQALIIYAERLKACLVQAMPQKLVPPFQPVFPALGAADILEHGSKLHNCEFPPWKQDTLVKAFDIALMKSPIYTDDTNFTLSAAQIENFSGWVRPAELFQAHLSGHMELCEEIMMGTSDKSDLIQDITTDCSVVASLSAAYNVLVGKHAILSSIFFPFNHSEGRPRLSETGKYIIKLNFNGCARRVTIDDRLPSSFTDRTLFVVDRNNPCLLWPALLEKAYLKVRGGYDFPGSNSGTDLWVLMGWIPEQIFLQREDVDIDQIWKRLESAYLSHDLVITLGTGRISVDEEQIMGLIGEHDYAVEAIDPSVGARRLLIKNPWCDGPTMTTLGVSTSRPLCADQPSSRISGSSKPFKKLGSKSRLWVGIEDVAQHFESMYLNWNPSLFSHRQDHHFSWTIPTKTYRSSLSQNPQFSVASPKGKTVWILVSRHFVDAELDIARSRRNSMAAVAGQLGFMSILVFENAGHKVQISDREFFRGPYVDSPQTLARLDIQPGRPYTIVIDQHELPLPQYSFTMSLFSHSPVTISEATDTMSNICEKNGAWTRRTAGGNSSHATFSQNPQYRLEVAERSPVSILLSADINDIHVHLDVVWAKGNRVAALRMKDLVASSGEYRRGCAEVNMEMLEPGKYTVICSTFDHGQLGRFVLRVASMTPLSFEPVLAEAAGRLVASIPHLRLATGDMKCRISVGVSWLTKASVSMQSASIISPGTTSGLPSSLMIRVSIVLGWGPEQVIIAEAGETEFQDPSATIRTPNFDLEPERIRRLGLWILIESVGSHNSGVAIKGEILSDSPVRLGTWETV